MLLRFQKAAVRGNYETRNQAFSMHLRFLTIRDPKFRGETRYLDIVPNARVVSSETVDADGQRLAVALTTLDLEPTEDGTNLTVTIQMVSFVEPDMIHSYESGNKSALKNLSLHLSNIPSA
jgi:uncharacterized protein YndB with AHSA1/START domain